MAKYIKQELPDLHKTGKKRVYYRLKTEKNIDAQEFVEQICLQSPGLSRGDVARVLMHATDTLARLLSEGNAVTVDEMGVFRASVGLEADKEKETVDGDDPKRNARSLYINGVKFQPDKGLVNKVDRCCKLRNMVVSCAPVRPLILFAANCPNAAEPPARFIRQTIIPRITRKIMIPTLLSSVKTAIIPSSNT